MTASRTPGGVSVFTKVGLGLAGLIASAGAAVAANVGAPVDFQMGLQPPVTEVARSINNFHDLVNVIIIAITLFVLGLMVYVMWRFSEKNNPEPSRTTHHTMLEVAWTVVPIIILVIIAVPSFRLLNLQYSYPEPDLTIKATGFQWAWLHSYPDYGDFEVESYMLDDAAREERIAAGRPSPRTLAVDNEILVPVNKNVHVLVTAQDVIHNWTIPSFGSKVDAVPGRITATWFRAEEEGIYYGQCSELCGDAHAFMPIAVRVVSEDTFQRWATAMQEGDDEAAAQIVKEVAIRHARLNEAQESKVARNSATSNAD